MRVIFIVSSPLWLSYHRYPSYNIRTSCILNDSSIHVFTFFMNDKEEIYMNILLTGGTGFIGQHVVEALHHENIHTYILTRFPENYVDTERASYISYDISQEKLPQIHGVINLPGESLFGYWTRHKKKEILNSRMKTTRDVLQIIKRLDRRPDVFISGSAIGFYGMSEDTIFTENTETPGDDYLARVAVQWEKAASAV